MIPTLALIVAVALFFGWLIVRFVPGHINYDDALRSTHWRVIRAQARQRAGNRCERCGIGGVPFECHHLTYRHLGRERLSEVEWLCGPCHDVADAERRRVA